MQSPKPLYLSLILAVIAFLLYAQTYNFDYAWDDAIVITENDRVQKGISGIPKLFYKYKSLEIKDKYGYRPITLSTFALEISLWGGLKSGPMHITNSLLYGLLAFLIFYVLIALFPGYSPWLYFLTCLLFVIHPSHVEVVANIKSRDEILMLIFALCSLNFFLKFIERKKLFNFLLSFVFIILAFLSRESAIYIPGLIILTYLFKTQFNFVSLLKTTFPFAVLAVVLLLFNQLIYYTDLFVIETLDLQGADFERKTGDLGNILFTTNSISIRLATGILILGMYLKLFFIGGPLIHDYGQTVVPLAQWSDVGVWISIIAYILLIGLAIKGLKNKTPWSYGICFYLISIFLFAQIPIILPDFFADRYLFTPSLGLCIAVIFGLNHLLKNVKLHPNQKHLLKSISLIVFLLITAFYSLTSFKRTKAWKNTTTLIKTDLPALQNCSRTQYNYALILQNQYYSNPNGSSHLIPKIIDHLEKAVNSAPTAYLARLDLGSVYMEFNQPEKAVELFENTITMYPHLAMPYNHLGKYYLGNSELELAKENFQKAINITPELFDAIMYLAATHYKLNDLNSAITVLENGVKESPTGPEYYILLGDLHLADNNAAKAKEAYKLGLNIDPQNQKIIESLQNLD